MTLAFEYLHPFTELPATWALNQEIIAAIETIEQKLAEKNRHIEVGYELEFRLSLHPANGNIKWLEEKQQLIDELEQQYTNCNAQEQALMFELLRAVQDYDAREIIIYQLQEKFPTVIEFRDPRFFKKGHGEGAYDGHYEHSDNDALEIRFNHHDLGLRKFLADFSEAVLFIQEKAAQYDLEFSSTRRHINISVWENGENLSAANNPHCTDKSANLVATIGKTINDCYLSLAEDLYDIDVFNPFLNNLESNANWFHHGYILLQKFINDGSEKILVGPGRQNDLRTTHDHWELRAGYHIANSEHLALALLIQYAAIAHGFEHNLSGQPTIKFPHSAGITPHFSCEDTTANRLWHTLNAATLRVDNSLDLPPESLDRVLKHTRLDNLGLQPFTQLLDKAVDSDTYGEMVYISTIGAQKLTDYFSHIRIDCQSEPATIIWPQRTQQEILFYQQHQVLLNSVRCHLRPVMEIRDGYPIQSDKDCLEDVVREWCSKMQDCDALQLISPELRNGITQHLEDYFLKKIAHAQAIISEFEAEFGKRPTPQSLELAANAVEEKAAAMRLEYSPSLIEKFMKDIDFRNSFIFRHAERVGEIHNYLNAIITDTFTNNNSSELAIATKLSNAYINSFNQTLGCNLALFDLSLFENANCPQKAAARPTIQAKLTP